MSVPELSNYELTMSTYHSTLSYALRKTLFNAQSEFSYLVRISGLSAPYSMKSGCSLWLGWTVLRGWSWPRLPLSLIRSQNYRLTKSNPSEPRPYQTISKHEKLWIAWSRAAHTGLPTSTSRVGGMAVTLSSLKTTIVPQNSSSWFRSDTIFWWRNLLLTHSHPGHKSQVCHK